jgi:glycosyltransferase involved in cell wall biosynthesis
MRVCVLNSVFPPFESRLFHRTIKALVAAGHHVTLIGPHDKKKDWVDGVHLLGFSPVIPVLLRPLNWLRIISRLRSVKADAYHFHDPELLPMGLFLTWLTGRPVVYDCFEHYPRAIMSDERIPKALRSPFSQAFGFVERKIAEQLAAVIVLAVYAKDDSRFGNVRRLAVVRNVPSREMFEELPDVLRKRQLIHIGDISESRRGISVLIEMLSLMRNKDVSLLFVGKSDTPRTRAYLDALISEKKLGDRVTFVAQVPYEAVKSYLTESSVGLIPIKAILRWEFDIPQKTFEYMACWLPYVVSQTTATRKFVAETESGLVVEAQSAQAYASAVDFLLEYPEEARRMAEKGRQAFLEEYNWEMESQKLLSLYESLSQQR